MLEVRGLRIAAGARELVHGVDLDVARGESLGIVGESGSCKSLTCRAVLGVLPRGCTHTGRIAFAGRLGAVFQDPGSFLNPSIPVGRQLAEVAGRRRARELLDRVELEPGVYRQLPSQLSGGMQQRVMIAIAIAGDPDLIVADEPKSALDTATQAAIVALLRSLRRSLLFVSHDAAVVDELSDRVVTFDDGRIVA